MVYLFIYLFIYAPFQSQDRKLTGLAETDSWIDVSSQPSDSQYISSSDDHIITAGLRISQNRRKRRGTARPTSRPQELLESETSSDEDDNEGEGEDMGTLIHSMTMSSDDYSSADDDDDDDDESDDEASASDTNAKVFPSSQRPGVPYRRQTPIASSSYNNRGGRAYLGYNSFAPNHATDHDAALRASLSTLLSCAAAARGLPKSSLSQTSPGSMSQYQGGRVAVDSLTLVREGGEPSSSNAIGKSRSLSITSNATSSASRSPSSEQLAKKGRKSSSGERKRSSKSASKPRQRSRSREETEMSLSNISYMTLAISAGAIVVLSALTFSAGYAFGREAGKGEGGLLGTVGRSAEGGKAVVKGTGRSIRMGTRFSSVAAF